MKPWVRIGIGITGLLAAVMQELLFSQSRLFQWELVIFLRVLEVFVVVGSLFFVLRGFKGSR